MSRTQIPRGVAVIIGEYAALWQFPKWITDLNFGDNEQKIHQYISQNTMAMDIVDESKVVWQWICENPADWAVDLLLANPDKHDLYHIARNRNPRAFAIVEEKSKSFSVEHMQSEEIDEMLSTNPLALGMLLERPRLIDQSYLPWNPSADVLIKQMKLPIHTAFLRGNDADWAVDILLKDIANIDGNALSTNENPRIVTYLIAHPEKIHWKYFSQNPTAIEYLRANPTMVKKSIYGNPAALEPIIPDGLIELLMA